MSQHEGKITDPAWQALVVRPQFREELLANDALTYDGILGRDYTPELRAEDTAWAQRLRYAQRHFDGAPDVTSGSYDLENYVSYAVGNPYFADGTGLKVLIEVADFGSTLTPERYREFAAHLGERGFDGDTKIDLRLGQVRFQYNNVIVHTPHVAMARCAEAVAIEVFGDSILHVARGVDVRVDGKLVDWHHFVLTGRFEELPEDVRAFVRYEVPIDVAACVGL